MWQHIGVHQSTCTTDPVERREHRDRCSRVHPQLRGARGIESSSTPSSFGKGRVSNVSWDAPNTRDAKLICVALPESDIVSIDHGLVGSTAAFFKESMRRDAMTGTKTMFALQDEVDTSVIEYQPSGKKDLHPGHELDFLLNTSFGSTQRG